MAVPWMREEEVKEAGTNDAEPPEEIKGVALDGDASRKTWPRLCRGELGCVEPQIQPFHTCSKEPRQR